MTPETWQREVLPHISDRLQMVRNLFSRRTDSLKRSVALRLCDGPMDTDEVLALGGRNHTARLTELRNMCRNVFNLDIPKARTENGIYVYWFEDVGEPPPSPTS